MSSSAATEQFIDLARPITLDFPATDGRYGVQGFTSFCYRASGQAKRSVLLPISTTNLWKDAAYAARLRRTVGWLPDHVNDPDAQYGPGVPVENEASGNCTVRCVTSTAEAVGVDGEVYPTSPYTLHLPMFDVDIPRLEDCGAVDDILAAVFQADRYWIPSTSNWHVYIDTPGVVPTNRGITWGDYETILQYLGQLCLDPATPFIDRGWSWHTRQEQQAVLRDPLGRKRVTIDNTPLVCMWCAEPFSNEFDLAAHEEVCA